MKKVANKNVQDAKTNGEQEQSMSIDASASDNFPISEIESPFWNYEEDFTAADEQTLEVPSGMDLEIPAPDGNDDETRADPFDGF